MGVVAMGVVVAVMEQKLSIFDFNSNPGRGLL